MRYGILSLIGLSLAGLLFSGAVCEKIATPDLPPQTFFQPGTTPPETLYVDNWTFKWFGRDPDSDFHDYYYKMFVGAPCDSSLPDTRDSTWTRTQLQTASYSFADAATFPDTTYVFEVMTVDEFGVADLHPAHACFRVAIQLPPMIDSTRIVLPPARTGVSAADFGFGGVKKDRQGHVESTVTLYYSEQITQIDPPGGVLDPFGAFTPATTVHYPKTGEPPLVSGATYRFQVRAIDKNFPDIVSDTYSVDWHN